MSISLFIYLFGVIGFYYSLRIQVDSNVNKEMEKRKFSIIRQMEEAHSSTSHPLSQNEIVLVSPVDGFGSSDRYNDTLIYNHEEQRYQLYRQLGFNEKVNNQVILHPYFSIAGSDRYFDNPDYHDHDRAGDSADHHPARL